MAEQETEQVRQIVMQLMDLYQFRHSVLPEHCDLYRPSLDEHLHEPTTNLLAWVANHSDRLCASHLEPHKQGWYKLHLALFREYEKLLSLFKKNSCDFAFDVELHRSQVCSTCRILDLAYSFIICLVLCTF